MAGSHRSDSPRGNPYDLVVIGAGSAGLSVAAGAAKLGLSVALIEADRMGGECLNVGCVPSKSLIHCARVAAAVRDAATFGVNASVSAIDGAKVFDYVHSRIAVLEPHDSAERFRSLGCHVFFGRAKFIDSKSIALTSDGPESIRLAGRKFVVATGSSPRVPAIPGLREAGFRNNNDIFRLTSIPKRLAVIGGGPIGVELAQAFHSLGSEVTVVQSGARILPRDDEELAFQLQSILERQGIRILTSAKTISVESGPMGKTLTIERGLETSQVVADEILVATGRMPNADLNLDAAEVEFNEHGIVVDAKMRTTARGIFACGDVVGPHRFTHMAGHQAGVVIANAIFHWPRKVQSIAVPWCTFTDPELANIGLTKADADSQGMACRTFVVNLSTCDRAVCDSAEGAVKIVVDKRDRLLGAQVLAPRAGEMIHEFAVLMASGSRLSGIRDAIHCYPTYSEAVSKAVSAVYSSRLFSDRTRTLVRWIQRLLG